MPVMSSWARLIAFDGVLDFACLYVVLELKSTSFFFACQHLFLQCGQVSTCYLL